MLITTYSHVGIIGSRNVGGHRFAKAQALAQAVAHAHNTVVTGCARGADAAARSGTRSVNPAYLKQFAAHSQQPRHLVARSILLVGWLANCHRPALVAFPLITIPQRLNTRPPKLAWQPCGSGTWSSVALAAAHGLPLFVWAHDHQLPHTWGAWQRLNLPNTPLHRFHYLAPNAAVQLIQQQPLVLA